MKKSFLLPLLIVLFLSSNLEAKKFPWNKQLKAPLNEDIYLVIKGDYSNLNAAKKTQDLIQTTLKQIPGDGLVSSNHLSGLPKNRYIVGSLFDSVERAKWWVTFSNRNPRLPKPKIKKIRLLKESKLPYMPNHSRNSIKRFISEQDAIKLVSQVSDIKVLRAKNSLKFVITDYPRSGDLRYEVEVLKLTRNNKRGVMVDFFMVDAVNEKITERYTQSIKPKKKSWFR